MAGAATSQRTDDDMLISHIKYTVRRAEAKVQWRRRNPHNFTTAVDPFDMSLVSVGRATYGPIRLVASGRQGRLTIGSWCSIAGGVTFVMNDEHPLDRVSTYPFRVMTLGQREPEALSRGGITVGDDVWIGFGATILDGVTIGQGAVVGARAVVTRDVGPYEIVGGCPAHVIRRRFDDETVAELLRIDWSLVDADFVGEHRTELVEGRATPEGVARLVEDLRTRKVE